MNGIQGHQKNQSIAHARNVIHHIGIFHGGKMGRNQVSYKRLHEVLNYNPETGIFQWKKSRSGIKRKNLQAGFLHPTGYIYIKIEGKNYSAHRLAFFYIHGYLSENDIDHKDRIRNHNWINNLREVSKSCNMRNCNLSKNNKTKITGISLSTQCKKYRATISANNKRIHLGVFKTKKEAAQARWEAEKKYGFPNCNTTSSALKYIKECNGTI